MSLGLATASVIGCVLFGATQSRFEWWWMSLFALAPWLAAVRSANGTRGAAVSFVGGTAFGLASSFWIPSSIENLGGSPMNGVAAWLAAASLLKGASFLAIGLAIRVARNRSDLAQLWLAIAVLSACELGWEPSFLRVPWAPLAGSQLATIGVAQLAVVFQSPVPISGLVLAVNFALSSLVLSRFRAGVRLYASLLCGWLALATFGLEIAIATRPEVSTKSDTLSARDERLQVLIVQPNFPREERWTPDIQLLHLRSLARRTRRAIEEAHTPVDAILWPETIVTQSIDKDEAIREAIWASVDSFEAPLLTGLMRDPGGERDDGTYRNTIAWLLPGTGLVSEIDKSIAVPIVEARVPGRLQAAAHLVFGMAARSPKAWESPLFEPLPGPVSLVPVICHEALFSSIASDRRALRAKAIVNVADDSWSHGDTATEQLTAFARFRAIEQRLPLVRVAHGGLSAVFDEFGRERTRLPLDQFATAVVELGDHAPPGLLERTVIFLLPLGAGLAIWWIGGVAAHLRASEIGAGATHSNGTGR